MADENIYVNPQVPDDGKADGKSVAGLILGILAIPACCCYGIPGIILAFIALILSLKGRKAKRCGLATAAVVISVIALILSIVYTIYFVWFLGNNITAEDWERIKNGDVEGFLNDFMARLEAQMPQSGN